ncbi:hypothetical protein [Actinoplanes derwentensis]|uniref:Uncharacterized protein n=1 Tax=Actinoplanes derwentensis TaxID=113562 RepID=A0A1H2BU18_9ACTN|nr:hypothetical protein [Actinoplanes derwentensis]GID83054.1 hypothetical protein Ade03nite_19780 [Actinoplanes derwentensis]SDT61256.1 hypothetical protein SAMN04489716_4859 [Actinoplanes derwentensis]
MRLLPLIAGAALVIATAAPAGANAGPAAVTFDFKTNTGFVDATNLLQGFDWNAGRLAREAATISFHHTMIIEEIWSLTCTAGAKPFTATRVQQDMKIFLTDTPVYSPDRAKVTGFRITGSNMGISATTAGFETGYPCPKPGHGKTIRSLRRIAETTTRTLLSEAGDKSTALFQTRTGPPARPESPVY